MGRDRSRWRWVLLGVGLVALAAAVITVIRAWRGPDGLSTAVGVAALVAFMFTVRATASGLIAWWRKQRIPTVPPTDDELEHAKAVLAGIIAEQWEREAAARSLDDPIPIPVRLRLVTARRDGKVMDHANTIFSGRASLSGSSDHVNELVAEFRGLRRRRLVIVGGPGSGKTTLAVQIVRELVSQRTRPDHEPVPVLLSIADWDVQRYPRLQSWLAFRLGQDYPVLLAPSLGAEVPQHLVERGQILARRRRQAAGVTIPS